MNSSCTFTFAGPASRPQRRTSDDWARPESLTWLLNTDLRHCEIRKRKKRKTFFKYKTMFVTLWKHVTLKSHRQHLWHINYSLKNAHKSAIPILCHMLISYFIVSLKHTATFLKYKLLANYESKQMVTVTNTIYRATTKCIATALVSLLCWAFVFRKLPKFVRMKFSNNCDSLGYV